MPAPCGLALQAKSDPFPTRFRSNPSSGEAYDHRDLGATNAVNAYLMAVNQKAESGCGKRKARHATDVCIESPRAL